MNTALEQLSKHELIALLREREISLVQKQEKTDHLQFQMTQLQRMLFGQKRERIRTYSSQLPLPFETTQQQQEEIIEKIEYVRKKQNTSAHKGSIALPAHLPVGAARGAAMVYSFFAICKKHEVNPFQWLKHTLENIMYTNHKKSENTTRRTSSYLSPKKHDAIGEADHLNSQSNFLNLKILYND